MVCIVHFADPPSLCSFTLTISLIVIYVAEKYIRKVIALALWLVVDLRFHPKPLQERQFPFHVLPIACTRRVHDRVHGAGIFVVVPHRNRSYVLESSWYYSFHYWRLSVSSLKRRFHLRLSLEPSFLAPTANSLLRRAPKFATCLPDWNPLLMTATKVLVIGRKKILSALLTLILYQSDTTATEHTRKMHTPTTTNPH